MNMKSFLSTTLLLLLGFMMPAWAVNQVQIMVTNTSNPMPPQGLVYMDQPGRYFKVSLTNTSDVVLPVRLEVSLHGPLANGIDSWNDNEGSYLEVYSDRYLEQGFTLLAHRTTMLTEPDFNAHFRQYAKSELHVGGAIQEAYTSARNGVYGLLPEGRYGIKVTAKTNYSGETGGDVVGEGYCYFDICYNATAPEFIWPLNEQNLADSLLEAGVIPDATVMCATFPTQPPYRFQWTQPTFNMQSASNVSRQFTYDFELIRVGKYQTVEQALNSNAVIYKERGLTQNFCDIPTFIAMQYATPEMSSKTYLARVKAVPVNNDPQQANYTRVTRAGDDDYSAYVNQVSNNGYGRYMVLGTKAGAYTSEEVVVLEEIYDDIAVDRDDDQINDIKVVVTAMYPTFPNDSYALFGNPGNYFSVQISNQTSISYNVNLLPQIYSGEFGITPRPKDQVPHASEVLSLPSGTTKNVTGSELDRLLGGYNFWDLVEFNSYTGRVIGDAPRTFPSTVDTLYIRVVQHESDTKPISSQPTRGKGRLPIVLLDDWTKAVSLDFEKVDDAPYTSDPANVFERPGDYFKVKVTNYMPHPILTSLRMAINDLFDREPVTTSTPYFIVPKNDNGNGGVYEISGDDLSEMFGQSDLSQIKRFKNQEFINVAPVEMSFSDEGTEMVGFTAYEHPTKDSEEAEVFTNWQKQVALAQPMPPNINIKVEAKYPNGAHTNHTMNYFRHPSNFFRVTLENESDISIPEFYLIEFLSHPTDKKGYLFCFNPLEKGRTISLPAHTSIELTDEQLDALCGGYHAGDLNSYNDKGSLNSQLIPLKPGNVDVLFVAARWEDSGDIPFDYYGKANIRVRDDSAQPIEVVMEPKSSTLPINPEPYFWQPEQYFTMILENYSGAEVSGYPRVMFAPTPIEDFEDKSSLGYFTTLDFNDKANVFKVDGKSVLTLSNSELNYLMGQYRVEDIRCQYVHGDEVFDFNRDWQMNDGGNHYAAEFLSANNIDNKIGAGVDLYKASSSVHEDIDYGAFDPIDVTFKLKETAKPDVVLSDYYTLPSDYFDISVGSKVKRNLKVRMAMSIDDQYISVAPLMRAQTLDLPIGGKAHAMTNDEIDKMLGIGDAKNYFFKYNDAEMVEWTPLGIDDEKLSRGKHTFHLYFYEYHANDEKLPFDATHGIEFVGKPLYEKTLEVDCNAEETIKIEIELKEDAELESPIATYFDHPSALYKVTVTNLLAKEQDIRLVSDIDQQYLSISPLLRGENLHLEAYDPENDKLSDEQREDKIVLTDEQVDRLLGDCTDDKNFRHWIDEDRSDWEQIVMSSVELPEEKHKLFIYAYAYKKGEPNKDFKLPESRDYLKEEFEGHVEYEFEVKNRILSDNCKTDYAALITDKEPGIFGQNAFNGKTVEVGAFKLTITSFKQDEKTKALKGSGYVTWTPQGMTVNVNCTFDELYVNKSFKCYKGEVVSAQVKEYPEYKESIPYSWFDESSLKKSRADYIAALKEKLKGNDKSADFSKYYKYTQQSFFPKIRKGVEDPITLPAAVPNELLSEDGGSLLPVDVQILRMSFAPDHSYMDMVGMLVLPEINTEHSQNIIMFGAPRLCITGGKDAPLIPADGAMAMMTDYVINEPNTGIEFSLIAPVDWSDVMGGCYFGWADHKFDVVTVKAGVTIPGLKAVDENWEMTDRDAKGTASFTFRDKENWGCGVSLEKFQVEDLEGYTFIPGGDEVGIYYDHSKKESPHGIEFPETYNFEAAGLAKLNADGAQKLSAENTAPWQGLYIQEIGMRFPDWLETTNDEDSETHDNHLTVGVKNLIIDGSGFSSQFYAESSYQLKSGGWSLSLDTIALNITQNSFDRFYLNGKFSVPVISGKIGYYAGVQAVKQGDKKGTKVEFRVEQKDTMNCDLGIATLEFKKGQTFFDLTYNSIDDRTTVELCAGGVINLKSPSDGMPLKMVGIEFVGMRVANFEKDEASYQQKLDEAAAKAGISKDDLSEATENNNDVTLNSDPKDDKGYKLCFDIGRWKLASPQKELGPFAISLNKLNLATDMSGDNVRLGISVAGDISICDVISAGAGVTIWGMLDDEKNLKYDRTSFDKISFGTGSKLGVIKIAGELEAKDDEENGHGYCGFLDLDMPGDVFSVHIEGGYFTKTKSEEERQVDLDRGIPDYKISDTYSWGYFEGKGSSSALANIQPVSLSDIEGGFYFNCNVEKKASYLTFGGMFGMKMTVGGDAAIKGGVKATILYDAANKRLSNFTFKGDVEALKGMVKANVTLVYDHSKDEEEYIDLLVTVDAEADAKSLAKKMGIDVDAIADAMAAVDQATKAYQELTGMEMDAKAPESGLDGVMGKDDSELAGDQSTSEKSGEGGKSGMSCKAGFKINMNIHVQLKPTPKKWHVWIGEPDFDKRCEVIFIDFKVGNDFIGASAKEYANGYLCFGNELPNGGRLPEIPTAIKEFLYGSPNPDDAKAQEEIFGKKEPVNLSRGDLASQFGSKGGFMCGAEIGGEFEVNAAICYANLQMLAGFDLILQQLGDGARCSNSGKSAGRNGFYATGQIYAMLKGDIGIIVNLWLVKGRFSICRFGIGALLKGGLPNPSWVYGKARAYCELLGGLISFHTSVTFKAGEVCIPDYGNPLDNIKIFGDVQPGDPDESKGWDTDNAVSAYIVPRFNTNMVMDKSIALIDENSAARRAGMDDEPSKYYANSLREYRFVLGKNERRVHNGHETTHDMYVKKYGKNKTTIEDITVRTNDHQSYEVDYGGRFDPETQYLLHLTGYGQEYCHHDGDAKNAKSWGNPYFNDEESGYEDEAREWYQEVDYYFVTKPLPDALVEEDIAVARPGNTGTFAKNNKLYKNEAARPYLSLTSGDRWNQLKRNKNFTIYGKLEEKKSGQQVYTQIGRDIEMEQVTVDKDIYIWQPKSQFQTPGNFNTTSTYRFTIFRRDDNAANAAMAKTIETLLNESRYLEDAKNAAAQGAGYTSTGASESSQGNPADEWDITNTQGTLDLAAQMKAFYEQELEELGLDDVDKKAYELAGTMHEDFTTQLYQSEFTVMGYTTFYSDMASRVSASKTDFSKFTKLGNTGLGTLLKVSQNWKRGSTNYDALNNNISDEQVYHDRQTGLNASGYPVRYWQANPYLYIAYWMNFGMIGSRRLSSSHTYFNQTIDNSYMELIMNVPQYRNVSEYTGHLVDLPNMNGSYTAMETRDMLKPVMFYREKSGRQWGYDSGQSFPAIHDTIKYMLTYDAAFATKIASGIRSRVRSYQNTSSLKTSTVQDGFKNGGKNDVTDAYDSYKKYGGGKLTYKMYQAEAMMGLTTKYGSLSFSDTKKWDIGLGRADDGSGVTSSSNYGAVPIDNLVSSYNGSSTDYTFYSNPFTSTLTNYKYRLYRVNGYHTTRGKSGYAIRSGTYSEQCYDITVSHDGKSVSGSTAYSLEDTSDPNKPTYICDVAISIHSNMYSAQNALTNQGYNMIPQDLNASAGGKYVYLGYKETHDNTRGITRFMVKVCDKEEVAPKSFTYDGRTFNRVNYLGEGYGDMNNGISKSKYLYLYESRTYNYKPDSCLASIKIENKGKGAESAIKNNPLYAYSYKFGKKNAWEAFYNSNLNEFAGGDRIYLLMNYKQKPPVQVSSNVINFISDIMVVASTSESVAKNILTNQGYTVLYTDMNLGISKGKRVYIGYKTSQKNEDAITDVVLYQTDTEQKDDFSFNMYGKTYTKCKFLGSNYGDLNAGASKPYIYLAYTKDGNLLTGEAVTGLRASTSSSAQNDDDCIMYFDGANLRTGGNANAKNQGTPVYIKVDKTEYYGDGTKSNSYTAPADVYPLSLATAASDDAATAQYELLRNNYELINVDLNGSGKGKRIYMGYKTTTSKKNAIKDIIIRVGKESSNSMTYAHNDASYRKATVLMSGKYGDLNEDAGGSYLYLYYTNDCDRVGNYIRNIELIDRSSSSSSSYYAQKLTDQTTESSCDLDESAKTSRYIYLKMNKSTDSSAKRPPRYYTDFAVSINSNSQTAKNNLINAGYKVLDTDVTSGSSNSYYCYIGYKYKENDASGAISDVMIFRSPKYLSECNFIYNNRYYYRVTYWDSKNNGGDMRPNCGNGYYYYLCVTKDSKNGTADAVNDVSLINKKSNTDSKDTYAHCYDPESPTHDNKNFDFRTGSGDHIYLDISKTSVKSSYRYSLNNPTISYYITDVAVSARYGDSDARKELTSRGYTVVSQDLNKNAGGDCVYIGYKYSYSAPAKVIDDLIIYERDKDWIDDAHETVDMGGKTWYKSEFFGNNYGDLNSKAGGKYLYLMYHKSKPNNAQQALCGLSASALDSRSSKWNYLHSIDDSDVNRPNMDAAKGAGGKWIPITASFHRNVSDFIEPGSAKAPADAETPTEFVSQVAVSFSSFESTAKKNLTDNGYTVINHDMLQSASGSGYCYMGVKYTSTASYALTDLMIFKVKDAVDDLEFEYNGKIYKKCKYFGGSDYGDLRPRCATGYCYYLCYSENGDNGNGTRDILTTVKVVDKGNGSYSGGDAAGCYNGYKGGEFTSNFNIADGGHGNHIYLQLKKTKVSGTKPASIYTTGSKYVTDFYVDNESNNSSTASISSSWTLLSSTSLNKGVSGARHIYGGYKSSSYPSEVIDDVAILQRGSELKDKTVSVGGKTWYRAEYLGASYGDVDKGCSGDYLYIIYHKTAKSSATRALVTTDLGVYDDGTGGLDSKWYYADWFDTNGNRIKGSGRFNRNSGNRIYFKAKYVKLK